MSKASGIEDHPWSMFFDEYSVLACLPSSRNPKLLMNGSISQRWRSSILFPAFRRRARLRKWTLRVQAALFPSLLHPDGHERLVLADFLCDVSPSLKPKALLIGTTGPTQKLTLQLEAVDGGMYFLKYAHQVLARMRLENEHRMLKSLPPSVTYDVLKYDSFSSGVALLARSVQGRPIHASLPIAQEVLDFISRLNILSAKNHYVDISVHKHPVVQELCGYTPEEGIESPIAPWLAVLDNRNWPLVWSHGDFAPWNLLLESGIIKAIDWEYGREDGFPNLDFVHYVLQIRALVSKTSPISAAHECVNLLLTNGVTNERAEAVALTCIGALYGHYLSANDGTLPNAELQRWRRTLWETFS
ncbi:hypothetical protein [Deinococcus marmoris]|uniref:hypothetical protein n=1 Tax=Deinococcus marmoris TaxID=249408 RepID=UPI000A6C194B|nr:hypothetical protein [Deinococcus marmoris]